MIDWLLDNFFGLLSFLAIALLIVAFCYSVKTDMDCANDPQCSIMLRVHDYECTLSHEVDHGKTHETVCDIYVRTKR